MYSLNYHCKWRLELAKQISEKIRVIEGTKDIKAIVVGGSVSRGYADEYSDIEILIFWDKLPDEDTRKLIVKELKAEYFPTFKWMYKSLENLKIKPKNIEQRFRDIFTCKPEEAYKNTLNILFETFDLVNKIYPEINTNIALNKLKSASMAHEYPVSIQF